MYVCTFIPPMFKGSWSTALLLDTCLQSLQGVRTQGLWLTNFTIVSSAGNHNMLKWMRRSGDSSLNSFSLFFPLCWSGAQACPHCGSSRSSTVWCGIQFGSSHWGERPEGRLREVNGVFFIFRKNIPWLCCDIWAVRRNSTPVSALEKILPDHLFLFQSEHAFFGALLMVGVFKTLFKTLLLFVCVWTSYHYNRWVCEQKQSVFFSLSIYQNVKEEGRLVMLEQWLF